MYIIEYVTTKRITCILKQYAKTKICTCMLTEYVKIKNIIIGIVTSKHEDINNNLI